MQINFYGRLSEKKYFGCALSVDCTDCLINEPYPFDTKWFSHKFKSAGLRYEIALTIHSGNISWVSGPFAAGEPDINIYRKDLKNYLCRHESVIADKGYRGEETCLITSEIKSVEENIQLIRSRHETVNKRLKQFYVLKHRFRHDKGKHGLCFHAVSQIVALCLHDQPLFCLKRNLD